MAVNKLTSLTLWAHPLGRELVLEWQLPQTLPTNFNIVVFRKLGDYATTAEIAAYFAGNPPAGVTVISLPGSTEPLSPYGMNDFDVINGTTYFYSVVVHDADSNDYSDTIEDNLAPATSVTTLSLDAKEGVLTAIVRLMTAYGLKEKKDYTIHRGYSIEDAEPLAIYVTRTSGQLLHQYLGNITQDTQANNLLSEGQLDIDIIQAVFEDPSDKQRDAVMMMFREGRAAMRRYLIQGFGLVYVNIVVEGDVINQAVKDRVQVGGMVVFECGVATEQQFEEEAASWADGEGLPVIE